MATDGAEEKKEMSDGFNRMMMRRPVAPELTLARLDPISLRRYLQKRVEFVNDCEDFKLPPGSEFKHCTREVLSRVGRWISLPTYDKIVKWADVKDDRLRAYITEKSELSDEILANWRPKMMTVIRGSLRYNAKLPPTEVLAILAAKLYLRMEDMGLDTWTAKDSSKLVVDTKALLKLIVTEIPDIWRQYVKDAIAGVKDVPLEEDKIR